jgi:small subunit ribosomal protein S6
VNEYEIMLMLDPDLAEERGNEIIQRIRDSVESAGGTADQGAKGTVEQGAKGTVEQGAKGTWDGHAPWGRRRMAYEINHKIEAVYHLLLFTCSAETLAEITRVLKITDGVTRHGAFKRVQGGHTYAPAPIPAVAVPHVSERSDDSDMDAE